jgi:two-component system, OmpR family, response regulator
MGNSMRVLVIEDEPTTAELVCEALQDAGYQAEHAADGRQGLERALEGPNQSKWDVIIADRSMPGLDGITVIQTLRRRGVTTPILMLSAFGDVDDRVTGLKAGSDDYLAKPFALVELLARVEALVRRAPRVSEQTTHLAVGDLQVDLVARSAQRAGREVELTVREFDLLAFLMRHVNQTVSRKELLEHVWGMHFDPQTNVVDVHMSRLRQAIDRDFDKPLIHTVRGEGYRLG